MPLELEPLPPERPAPRPRPGRPLEIARGPRALERPWRRLPRSVAVSLGFHALLLLAVALLVSALPAADPPPRRVRFEIRPLLAQGPPEAEPSGMDARAETPAEEPPRELAAGEEDGFWEDDAEHEPTLGAGAGGSGSPYASRFGDKRRLLAEGGGDDATEGALRAALDWLARHQSEDGRWDAEAFTDNCQGDPCEGPGVRPYPEAATALTLLAFLGAGHSHRAGPWGDTARRGLRRLVSMQRPDGSFGTDPHRAYASGLASLALCEAYALTGSPVLREPAQRSLDYWVSRQARAGGWRYHPGDGASDSSVTGWVALALVSGRRAGLAVPDRALEGCRRWYLRSISDDGAIGYVAAGTGGEALLGVGVFCLVMLGEAADSPRLTRTVGRLQVERPRWPSGPDDVEAFYGEADPLHWYYGGLAAFQCGGTTWRAWHERLRPLLLGHQERDGDRRGSWDPAGATGDRGGRVIMTALGALCLEVYYRYPRATSFR